MIMLARALWRCIAWLDLILFTLLMYALSFIPRSRFGRIYDRLFQTWSRTFVRALGVDLRLHQHYAGSLPAHYIVIANHPSAFEDIGIPALFPAYSVAKIEVRDWYFAGRISAAAGTLYVKREDKQARAEAKETIRTALLAKRNIAIYPEGGCKGRRIQPFLYGIFQLSLETRTPIVPVFIHYEAQEAFEWQGQTLPRKIAELLFAPNKTAHYHVYEPIDPGAFSSREDYTEAVHALYLAWQEKHLL
ncbi:lysophospholipid acyltransferase family protein [Granulosicoccaceae sp. 1_MG-2023]|nr:lysophospholipid acyltransferase family protein [Granulosicoccaceae sp. 1_MG-2023]